MDLEKKEIPVILPKASYTWGKMLWFCPYSVHVCHRNYRIYQARNVHDWNFYSVQLEVSVCVGVCVCLGACMRETCWWRKLKSMLLFI